MIKEIQNMENDLRDTLKNDTPFRRSNTKTTTSNSMATTKNQSKSMKNKEKRNLYLKTIRSMYLDGVPVTMIAKKMQKSRWGIYLALKECGVDTSLGLRGKRRTPSIVGDYLNGDWENERIGRSPKNIAIRLNIEVRRVHTALKNRKNSLVAIAERMPFEDFLTGGDIIDWSVDPYKMEALFSGIDERGDKKNITLTEREMIEYLHKMQSGK